MKNTPFKLRSGNKAAYSDLQKESPAKLAFLAPIFAWLGGGAAGTAGAAAAASTAAAGGTAAAGAVAAKAAAVTAGKAIATKTALSTGTSKLAAKGKKSKVKSIVAGDQPNIMQSRDEEKSV